MFMLYIHGVGSSGKRGPLRKSRMTRRAAKNKPLTITKITNKSKNSAEMNSKPPNPHLLINHARTQRESKSPSARIRTKGLVVPPEFAT
jgi:hypothetical protein